MKKIITALLLIFCINVFAQNIGVGTTIPDEKLQVDSVIRVGKNQTIPSGSTRKNLIKFGDGNYVTVGEQGKDDRLNMQAGSFAFKNGNGGVGDGGVGDGNVGIGQDSAKEKLDVAGNINTSGNMNVGGGPAYNSYGARGWGGQIVIHY